MKTRALIGISAVLAALSTAAIAYHPPQAPLPPPGFGAQGGARVLPGSTFPSTVSFNLWNGVIILPVILGDGLPIRAGLNTGLPLCIVSPQLAARKGMTPNGTREIEVLDHKITVANAPAQVIRVERVALAGVAFGVCDLMGQLTGKAAPDGPTLWLGASALEGLALTIDPDKSEITFRAANASVSGKAVKIPFVLRDGRMWVDVVANDKQKFEAVIDTGSVATLLPTKVATALQLKPESTLEMVDKNGKPAKVGVSKLTKVALGKLVAEEVPVLFVAEGDPQGINQEFAVIGNDFLFHHKVTIDFGRKEIAFEPLASTPARKSEKKPAGKEEKKDTKPDARPDAKPDARPDSKPELKPELKPDGNEGSKKEPAPPPTGNPPPASG